MSEEAKKLGARARDETAEAGEEKEKIDQLEGSAPSGDRLMDSNDDSAISTLGPEDGTV